MVEKPREAHKPQHLELAFHIEAVPNCTWNSRVNQDVLYHSKLQMFSWMTVNCNKQIRTRNYGLLPSLSPSLRFTSRIKNNLLMPPQGR